MLRRILKLYLVFVIDFHCLPWIREGGNCLLPLHAIDKNVTLIRLTLSFAEYCLSTPVRSSGLHFQKLGLLGSFSNNKSSDLIHADLAKPYFRTG